MEFTQFLHAPIGVNVLAVISVAEDQRWNERTNDRTNELYGAELFLSSYYFSYSSNLTLRRLMSYIYGAPILDVSRSHTTTQHSR